MTNKELRKTLRLFGGRLTIKLGDDAYGDKDIKHIELIREGNKSPYIRLGWGESKCPQ